MYSGLLEKTALSAGLGIAFGAIDAVGFFYTAKVFFTNSSGKKKTLAGACELLRLIVLIAFIIFLCSRIHVSFIPLAITAIFVSLGGKMVFIFKGLNPKNR